MEDGLNHQNIAKCRTICEFMGSFWIRTPPPLAPSGALPNLQARAICQKCRWKIKVCWGCLCICRRALPAAMAIHSLQSLRFKWENYRPLKIH